MRSFVLVAFFGFIAFASANPGFFNRGDVENHWEFGFETKTIPGRPIQLKIERGALPKEGEDKGVLNAIYTKHVERRDKLLGALLGKPAGPPAPAPPAPAPPAPAPAPPAGKPQSSFDEAKATFAILKQRHDERVKKLLAKLSLSGHKDQLPPLAPAPAPVPAQAPVPAPAPVPDQAPVPAPAPLPAPVSDQAPVPAPVPLPAPVPEQEVPEEEQNAEVPENEEVAEEQDQGEQNVEEPANPANEDGEVAE